MSHNHSSKSVIVERELMNAHQCENIQPILIRIGGIAMIDRMQFECDHRLNTWCGDRRGISFALFQNGKNIIIHQHQIHGSQGEIECCFILVEIFGFRKQPIAQS